MFLNKRPTLVCLAKQQQTNKQQQNKRQKQNVEEEAERKENVQWLVSLVKSV